MAVLRLRGPIHIQGHQASENFMSGRFENSVLISCEHDRLLLLSRGSWSIAQQLLWGSIQLMHWRPSEKMFSNLIARGISTSSRRLEMMNITKMETFNKRGTKRFKKEQYKKFQKKGEEWLDTNCPTYMQYKYLGAHADLRIHTYGARQTGVHHEAYWQEIPGWASCHDSTFLHV